MTQADISKGDYLQLQSQDNEENQFIVQVEQLIRMGETETAVQVSEHSGALRDGLLQYEDGELTLTFSDNEEVKVDVIEISDESPEYSIGE